MSQRTLDKLSDWAQWFSHNKDRGRDNDKEHEFIKRAVDELGGVVADLLGDIAELEGRPRETLGKRLLWTPTGVAARGDMTKFG
jgi:hypothetical protein